MFALMTLLSGFILFGGGPANDACACLPAGIERTEVVAVQRAALNGSEQKITVEQKLKELRARCRRGKLVDAKGKEIYFFRKQGCWGNPPEDYKEILSRQSRELTKLRRRYHVIEMTCNPDGGPPY
jgi:hypothetical protein